MNEEEGAVEEEDEAEVEEEQAQDSPAPPMTLTTEAKENLNAVVAAIERKLSSSGGESVIL